MSDRIFWAQVGMGVLASTVLTAAVVWVVLILQDDMPQTPRRLEIVYNQMQARRPR